MYTIGAAPGRVYSEAEAQRGSCPQKGTRALCVGNNSVAALTNLGRQGDPREYVLVQVGAAANLVNGNIVHITGDYNISLPGSAVAGVPNLGPLGVVIASITASLSALVWVQVAGLANALFEATTSAIPGAPVKLGGTSGQITAAAIVTASSYISGMQVMATVSAAGLGAVMLNYPRVISG